MRANAHERLSVVFPVRLRPTQMAMVRELAERDGRTVAGYIRRVVELNLQAHASQPGRQGSNHERPAA